MEEIVVVSYHSPVGSSCTCSCDSDCLKWKNYQCVNLCFLYLNFVHMHLTLLSFLTFHIHSICFTTGWFYDKCSRVTRKTWAKERGREEGQYCAINKLGWCTLYTCLWFSSATSTVSSHCSYLCHLFFILHHLVITKHLYLVFLSPLTGLKYFLWWQQWQKSEHQITLYIFIIVFSISPGNQHQFIYIKHVIKPIYWTLCTLYESLAVILSMNM